MGLGGHSPPWIFVDATGRYVRQALSRWRDNGSSTVHHWNGTVETTEFALPHELAPAACPVRTSGCKSVVIRYPRRRRDHS